MTDLSSLAAAERIAQLTEQVAALRAENLALREVALTLRQGVACGCEPCLERVGDALAAHDALMAEAQR